MSVDVQLVDGNVTAKITDGRNQVVALCDPNLRGRGKPNNLRFFSQNMDTVGDGTGTTAMNVNGSVNSVAFFIRANDDYDIRIMKFVIKIRDTAVDHAGFGNEAALTNGFDVAAVESGVITYFVEKAKSFSNLIEQTALESPFGGTATAFELINVDGTEDEILLPMTISDYIPNGLRVGRGTQDLMCAVVNDDLTGLTACTVRAIGHKHYPGS